MLDVILHSFIWRAIIAIAIAAAVSSTVGTFAVLRGFSTLSAAITHSSFAGASMAIICGVNPLLGALALSLGFSGLTAYASSANERKADVMVGMIFGFSTALAVFFLSMAGSYASAAWSFIVGDVLGVSWSDLLTLLTVSIISVGSTCLFYKY
ncbi:MAG: metal ABC transporter permease, partial [Thermoproteota archaeon]